MPLSFSLSSVRSVRTWLCRGFHNISYTGLRIERRNPVLLTLVRYRKVPLRKPSWMPRAKTKLFNFVEPRVYPEDELDQMGDLESNYKAQMASIMAYCAAENEMLKLKEMRKHDTADHEEFLSLLKINEEENNRVRKIREAVLTAELEAETQELLEKDKLEKEWLSAKKEEIENLVKYEKIESAHFVTLENIEEAISEAIDNPVNYSFAIDTKGNILTGTQPFQGSPYWTDDLPRERLGDLPPSRVQAPRVKRKAPFFKNVGRWA